jgi:hypothetical protein
MSNNPSPDGSNNRDSALSLVIESLQQHEQNLDNLIDQLSKLKPQIDITKKLSERFEKVEDRVECLGREIQHLTICLEIHKPNTLPAQES